VGEGCPPSRITLTRSGKKRKETSSPRKKEGEKKGRKREPFGQQSLPSSALFLRCRASAQERKNSKERGERDKTSSINQIYLFPS